MNPGHHLLFAVKLHILRRMRRWNVVEMARHFGVTKRQMESMLEGQHIPYSDQLVGFYAAGYSFNSEDFRIWIPDDVVRKLIPDLGSRRSRK